MELDFTSLKENLDSMRNKLKFVDENIKRLTGNSDQLTNSRSVKSVKRGSSHVEDLKSKRSFLSIKKRLSFPTGAAAIAEDDNVSPYMPLPQLISRIIPAQKEAPNREEVLRAQNADEHSKARNKRMFNSLLGTLQKFRAEESKMKLKEDKRAQVEKKLEEQEVKEKEELRKEKSNLFNNRKLYQLQIKALEEQMGRVAEFNEWEAHQNRLKNFLKTKSKPEIYYLPKVFNDESIQLLQDRIKSIEDRIREKKDELTSEIDILGNTEKHDSSNDNDNNNDTIADEKNENSFEENVDNCLSVSNQPEIEPQLENGSLDSCDQTTTIDLQTSDEVINGNSETDTILNVSNNDDRNQDDQGEHQI